MAAFFHFRFLSYTPASSSSTPKTRVTTPSHLVTVSSALRLGDRVHSTALTFHPLLASYFRDNCQPHILPKINTFSYGRALQIFETFHESFLTAQTSWLNFFGGKGSEDHKNEKLQKATSPRHPFHGRLCTNILLTLNILAYVAQFASNGTLISWGAKVNHHINNGQIWRLITSSFLHANVFHLMINCYSLNSVGPTVESFSGPKRFIAVYLFSAIASSAMSYCFCRSPSVGASGAIFGLVGSLGLFVLRHREIIGAGKQDFLQIVQVIALNMFIGLSTKGIDNWGHVGGFAGGVALSWFVGPAWIREFRPDDGRQSFADKAPIFSFINRKG